ncbi:hypothetical protein GCM10010919_17030 [Alishewanella longhuensis]|uniref:Uncharacterized protein n=1 Tax=Alishewanella longhuensis TaxID=1091037 RepID=A0ABQ3KYS6_9ALTE|nr:hypothetical protein GCM10010919_17030 [Alishewanella longhuensis]
MVIGKVTTKPRNTWLNEYSVELCVTMYAIQSDANKNATSAITEITRLKNRGNSKSHESIELTPKSLTDIN